jgi:hypothetical protein
MKIKYEQKCQHHRNEWDECDDDLFAFVADRVTENDDGDFQNSANDLTMARHDAVCALKGLGRLCEILAEKGILDVQDILRITDGREDEWPRRNIDKREQRGHTLDPRQSRVTMR